MQNYKVKNSNPSINEKDEFELDLKIPSVGEFTIKVRQEFIDKSYRALQKILPWLLSAAMGGSGLAFINGNLDRDQSPNHSNQSQIK